MITNSEFSVSIPLMNLLVSCTCLCLPQYIILGTDKFTLLIVQNDKSLSLEFSLYVAKQNKKVSSHDI